VALDRAHARRWPKNRQRSTAGDGGAPCTRGQSERERESERVGQRAQMREVRWASRARGSKGVRGRGRGRRTRGHRRVHGGEIVGERLGTADRWGRQDRERGSGRAQGKQRRHLGPTEQRERERGSERARVGADRRDPPVRHRGRAGAGAWPGLIGLAWAEMAFSFFLEFLLPFLFIFSRFFNSNSNQVSNSNQIKYVQQFKEYLGSI
jgi:hypothetical protein